MIRTGALVVAPYCTDASSSWYSPGRNAKLNQVFQILCSSGLPLIILNTCPVLNGSPLKNELQISRINAKFPRLISFLTLSRRRLPDQPYTIIWVYNSRVPEMILVWRLRQLYPDMRLIVELEDLPAARKANASWRGLLDWFSTFWLVQRASLVLCVSGEAADSLQARIPISPSRLQIFPPLLDNNFLSAVERRQKSPFSRHFIRVLYAGGYSPEKGVDDLLWAFSSLDPSLYRLHLVGPVTDSIRLAAREMPNVYVHGVIESNVLYTFYRLADVVVNPHRQILHGSHVFPFKSIEQAACGALPLQSTALNTGVTKLPSPCLFANRKELLVALYNSRQIWSDHQRQILQISESLRHRFGLKYFSTNFIASINHLL